MGVGSQCFLADILRIDPPENRPGGIVDQGLLVDRRRVSVLVHGRLQGQEDIVRLRSPGPFGQLVLADVWRLRRPGDAQRSARRRIGQPHHHAPRVGGVVSRSSENAERAVMAAGQLVEPHAIVHELAVLLLVLVIHQPHRGAAPDLADAAAGMPVQHPGGRIEPLYGADIARLRIDGVLPVRRERSGRRHGEGEGADLAVVDETRLRPVVAVRVVPPSCEAVELLERALQRVLVHVDTALLRQEQ